MDEKVEKELNKLAEKNMVEIPSLEKLLNSKSFRQAFNTTCSRLGMNSNTLPIVSSLALLSILGELKKLNENLDYLHLSTQEEKPSRVVRKKKE